MPVKLDIVGSPVGSIAADDDGGVASAVALVRSRAMRLTRSSRLRFLALVLSVAAIQGGPAGGVRLLGLVVARVPGNDESRAVMNLRQRSLPGQSAKEEDMVGGVILPAADVVRATELARQVWAVDQREALE